MAKESGREGRGRQFLGVLYNNQNPRILYGVIMLYKHVPGKTQLEGHEMSSPFVVAEMPSPDNVIVLGSVVNLIHDIQRLLGEVRRLIDELNATLIPFAEKDAVEGQRVLVLTLPNRDWEQQVYTDAKRSIADRLVLLSIQMRNLFQVFPHLNHSISLYNRDGNSMGTVKLKDLFNQLIHNRYFFVDGEHIIDLFSDRPRSTAPISRKFMGFRFNWIEYIETTEAALAEIKIKNFTQLLYKGIKNLSTTTPYADVVFLIQNLYSFSRLFRETNPSQAYGQVLHQLLSNKAMQKLNELKPSLEGEDKIHVTYVMQSPILSLHQDLSQKKFEVHVQCRFKMVNDHGRVVYEEQDFTSIMTKVKYERLLAHLDQAFGERQLVGFRA